MMLPISINKLSQQLGLTSRTLRHWESEGLFKSSRDYESGWRIYDEEAILAIRIITYLRKLNIPLKDIKLILDTKDLKIVQRIIKNQLTSIAKSTNELIEHKSILNDFLNSLMNFNQHNTGNSLEELSHIFHNILEDSKGEKQEDIKMIDNETNSVNADNNNVRFITLPPMRVAYNIAVGISPEDEAIAPVVKWVEESKLMGITRLLGGNVKPFPSESSPEYGYGMCAAIPESVEIPAHLKEMRLPGGLYAVMPSSDDIYGSWQLLMKQLEENNEYKPDSSRLCFEEHIRNDNADGQGSQFILNLLEPVKKR
ncbi:MerR family transcriptional regulator [Clostridium cellulovorans]|uniref:Transcriptional regulator, MerR family n=1 Tax=Clostridium cellulovorans (strain ATCC 35296 / DSM 3052 / OCM 3 / 743B) TaxID=573061 RepID=D9SV47_CLOC7|nr:MerR family transcriptional regulator [Clostridium cellulovorans]ADL53021.1 transcriptional regulator, MerR family [Clostridium cellulovorans 743B]